MKVKAIFSFDHDGARRRGDVFDISDRVGSQLVDKGLVIVADEGAKQNSVLNPGAGRRGRRIPAPEDGAEPK